MSYSPQVTKRRSRRHRIDVKGEVKRPKSVRVVDAPLFDLSAEGCKLALTEPLRPGTFVFLKIAGLELWPAEVVWSDGQFAGVEFQRPLSNYVVDHYIARHGLPAEIPG